MEHNQLGRIIACTRRNFLVVNDSYEIFNGKTLSKFSEITVGDAVTFSLRDKTAFLIEVKPRKNQVQRAYFDKNRNIAVNVDHLFITTSCDSLFNPLFIDKLFLVSQLQDISVSLVLNKIDLIKNSVFEQIDIYKKLMDQIYYLSCRNRTGVEELFDKITKSDYRTILFCGVSGVGKSSIINTLFPHANKAVNSVSEKTGQGKQTTTLAQAYIYERKEHKPLLVIDSPGIQNFGLMQISTEDVINGFPDIQEIGKECKFSNCSHEKEADCKVIIALKEKKMDPTRHASYLTILEETKKIPFYEKQ